VGSTVTLAVLDRDDESLKFTVVESVEAGPRRGWISWEVPVARPVIGNS
jgi:transcription elongation GreA/GreB family factor